VFGEKKARAVRQIRREWGVGPIQVQGGQFGAQFPERAWLALSRLDWETFDEHSPGVLTLIVGTNRPDANSRKVAAVVNGLYKGLGVPPHVLDLANLPPEIFSPSSYEEKPPSFKPFSDAVVNADGLIVVSPEYNGGMPGILKYFIDMLKFPESFERRPVCFVGVAAGMWGALRPIEQLELIFGYRNAYLYPERVFLPRIDSLLTDGGTFKDAELVERLKTQAVGFIDFVERLRGVKLKTT
jgi:NAD(P)H-dependent FMN reductase